MKKPIRIILIISGLCIVFLVIGLLSGIVFKTDCVGAQCIPIGSDSAIFFPNDPLGVHLQDGSTAQATCSTSLSPTITITGYASYAGGNISTRAEGRFPSVPAWQCDSGWNPGPTNTCTYTWGVGSLSVTATATSGGVVVSGTDGCCDSCTGNGSWIL